MRRKLGFPRQELQFRTPCKTHDRAVRPPYPFLIHHSLPALNQSIHYATAIGQTRRLSLFVNIPLSVPTYSTSTCQTICNGRCLLPCWEEHQLLAYTLKAHLFSRWMQRTSTHLSTSRTTHQYAIFTVCPAER